MIKRVEYTKPYTVTNIRSFHVQSSVYDFTIHPNQMYVIALNELGRVYLYNIEMAQFRGFIEV